MREIAGRRIWIIGASAGIGQALALALAEQGAQLILSARDRPALEQLAADCGGAEVLPLDLAQVEDLRTAIASIEVGSLDAVICAAALYQPGLVSDIEDSALKQLIAVNLTAMIRIGRDVPPLLRDGGQLVLFGSVAGYMGLPKGQPYSATKAAIANLAESLRTELAPRIDVRLVSPGFVRTRLTEKNDFNMPAIMTPAEAAQEVIKGMQGRRFEIHFPRRLTLALKLLRVLPYRLSLAITAKLGGSR